MYWTASGKNPRIERANLDGSERKELVHMPLRTPLVLTDALSRWWFRSYYVQ